MPEVGEKSELESFMTVARGQRTTGSTKKDTHVSYLPGPAVLTNIFSADHPAEVGRVGGAATPVG